MSVEVSTRLGRQWKQMSHTVKEPYLQEAAKIRLFHQQKYPDYKNHYVKPCTSLCAIYVSENHFILSV